MSPQAPAPPPQSVAAPEVTGAPPVEAPAPAGASGRPKTLEDLHIDELLHVVVDRNCSDLHICTDSEPIIREDGALKKLNYEKFNANQTQRMLYEILSDDQVTRFEQTLELDFSYQLPKRARFRVNLYRDRGAVAAAFRLISNRIPTTRELNLPPILDQLTERPRGLVLVTGPTGSGKSTSLAAMINHINTTRAVHIITIEDPIEYLHTHKLSIINQRELGSDTKSFSNALRACLREDPDVLLVGEMRDTETIALAITAAETGHLVFATLHTNNAAESIDRMIDVFPPGQQEQIRVQLSNNIVSIIAQQLLPRASGPGRVPVNEIMVATPAIRNLIRENKTHQIPSMIQTSGAHGMLSMDQCLRDLYMKGIITLDEALQRCQNVEELKKMINLGGAQGGPPQPRR
ncbi:MAG: type IV pilus twitching motility protein PilT [Fimbriimonadaceae bacterium]|nr:type IV pilus twitching motility protein PilT [Fimbriimonadaceae bacterium]